jgi:hypothetical protein
MRRNLIDRHRRSHAAAGVVIPADIAADGDDGADQDDGAGRHASLRDGRWEGEFGLAIDIAALTPETADRLIGVEPEGSGIGPHEADGIGGSRQACEITLLDRPNESGLQAQGLGNGIHLPPKPFTGGAKFPADARCPVSRVIVRFAWEA